MKCPACQQECAAGANHCLFCGARLVLVCEACGTELPAVARFCLQCGRSLRQPGPEAPARSTGVKGMTSRYLSERIVDPRGLFESERKHLTVLFSDLKGSMEILADRDPEESRKILDGVLELMMEAVHRYEGKVTQVMGDGIMALFGAPIAQENHGLQACCAALAMQASIGRYSDHIRRTQGVPVQIRMGLHSGEVVVHPLGQESETGRLGYAAVGRTVHVAARMEQAAAPGSILLTADTLRLVQGYVDARDVGPITLKGLREPEEAYELKGLAGVRSRLQAAITRGLTRFVNRETEVAALAHALSEAAEGRGQIVSVVGEPGLGKSRLLYEFGRSHAARGWLVLESTSTPHTAPPGSPVVDLLKGYLRLDSTQQESEISDRVTQKVLEVDRTAMHLTTALLALVEVPVADQEWNRLEPSQRLVRSLDSFVHLLLRESTIQPLLVIFDDLQSSDSVTQLFLDSFVRNLPSHRVMLLVGHRPDYQHGWSAASYFAALRLAPLARANAGAMVDALVGADRELAALKRLLIERTQGNPFFIEESVCTLVETGVFGGPRGAYRLEGEHASIRVPATVEAVLAARIDRLVPDEKRLLQCAAVVGMEVPLGLLQAIADLDEISFGGALAGLQAAEFLYVARFRPAPEYTFKHALTHQVAYERLLQERRRALHRRIVAELERATSGPGTKEIELLAHHAQHGEAWDKAVAYSRQAGIMAAARPAHREAVVRFEHALRALEHLPECPERTQLAIDICFDLRNSLQALGQLKRLLEYIQNVQVQAAQIDDRRRLGQASSFACQYYRLVGDVDAAINAGKRAIEIADKMGDVGLGIVARTHLGAAMAAGGEHRRATYILSETVRHLQGNFARDLIGTTGIISVFCRIYLATSLAEVGEFGSAMDHAREAMQIAEQECHIYSITFACYGVGTIRAIRGEVADAIAVLERGLQLCRSWNLPVGLPLIGTSLGRAYCLADRHQDAIELLEDAQERATIMGRMGGQAMLLVRLGEAYLGARWLTDADRCARLALSLSQAHQERGLQAYALRFMGELGMHDGTAPEESVAHFAQAGALAEELEMRPLLAQCWLNLGVAQRRLGQTESADTSQQRGIALFQALNLPASLGQGQDAISPPGAAASLRSR